MNPKITLVIVLLGTLLASCGIAPTPTPTATLEPTATLQPTATSEPSPTPEPVIEKAADLELILSDDFSDEDSGWSTFQDEYFDRGYAGEQYRMVVNGDNYYHWAILGPSYSDVRVEVDMYQTVVDPDSNIGLVCRDSGADGFFLATIAARGYYGIYRVTPTNYYTMVEDYTNVFTNVSAPNRVAFECLGDSLTLFVNDIFVARTSGSILSEGQFGFYVDSGERGSNEAFFDNFALYVPAGLEQQAQLEEEALLTDFVIPDLELAGYSADQGSLVFHSDEPIEINASLPNHRYYDYLGYPNLDFMNFVMGVDVKWDSKTGVAGCDILFRGEEDFGSGQFAEFSTMRLSGLPYWSLAIRRFNDIQGVLNEGASEAIKLTLGSVNHYVLAVEGSRATVYANGVRLGIGYLKESMVEGQIAFQAWQESGITTCTFSNTWVFELATEQ